ncbi:MAG: ATP-binding protein [Endomicrobia bacterium]|nr:ATP-binding protein [Bacillota bacterium]MCL1973060.1 ATP-binding protein [Endomicrobiia bacterium]
MSKYTRWLTKSVKEALKTRRVVVISGARQTGKTTLAKQVLAKNSVFRPLDKKVFLDAAKNDPAGFVQNKSGTMVIDEIQKVKDLIPEIKYVVDNNNRSGQYLLTGSADINALPEVSESMAGRIKNIRLRPLTIGEMLGRKPVFLDRAFSKEFPAQAKGYDKKTIFDLAFRGGFPEAVRLKTQKARKDWHKDYRDTLIKKDLKDVANIARQDTLKELIVIMASWSGKFMDITSICSALGLSKQTVTSYVNALEALFLFEKVAPWIKTAYDRVGRSHKIFATDTGFMTSVLGWKPDEVFLNVDRYGKLMETFIFQELSAQIDLDNIYSLYQYRDREKREIDFIIEREDGALLGVEVKSGHNVSKEDFAHQIWFRDNLVKDKRKYKGIVLYSGEDTLSFGEGLQAVPIAALWQE